MSKVKTNTEKDELDRYFNETLSYTELYLKDTKNSELVETILKWLDKLSRLTNHRYLRNQYLSELLKQLKSGNISDIFCKPPPRADLSSLPSQYQLTKKPSQVIKDLEIIDSVCQKCGQEKYMDKQVRPFVGRSSGGPESDSSVTTSNETQSPRTLQVYDKNIISTNSETDLNIAKYRCQHLSGAVRNFKIKTEKNFDHKFSKCHQDFYDPKEFKQLQLLVKQQCDEINELKSRLFDVQKIYESSEKSHRVLFHQCKVTMSEELKKFKSHLQVEKLKNTELNKKLIDMSQELKKITRHRDEELESIQGHYKKLLNDKEEELCLKNEELQEKSEELKQQEVIKREEILYLKNKIQELEEKLKTKIEDKNKLESLLSEQYSTMKDEFLKIRNEIESANTKQNQSLLEKIALLKKALLKMERSKQKINFECQQKIFEIQKSKELEIKAMELQLLGHKNELSTSLSTEKQCELDSILNLLEERYKNLLASSEANADNQRQKYLQKMKDFENQLASLKSNSTRDEMYI